MDQIQISVEHQNLRNLFGQTPEMVCILNGPNHVFEFVNDAHIKTLGFDATGMAVREAQPESVEVHGILDDVYRTGVTAELKEIPVTLSGRLRYFNLTYSARKNQQGVIDGIMILGTEITEQFAIREVLKNQNLAFQMTMEGAPLTDVLHVLAETLETHLGCELMCSILITTKDGKNLLHGAAPTLAQGYNDQIHGVTVGPNVGSCGTAAFTKKDVVVTDISSDPLWMDFRDLAKAYNLKSCWSQPIIASTGKVIGTFALYNIPTQEWSKWELQVINLVAQTCAIIIERAIDSEEKQEAQEALSESRELYQSSREQLGLAVEVAKVGFYDWDIVEDKISFSEQMRKDWGISDDVKSFKDITAYIHDEDKSRVEGLITKSMELNEPFHTQYRVKKEKGEHIWVDVRGEVRTDSDGNAIRFFGTSREVTEQKNKEDSLRIAQSSAENANRAKGLFLANMSHEIRTPLGAIMGFLDLLKKPDITEEKLQDYVGVIDRNSKQLLRIVDDVLDLSKIEAGKFTIESAEYRLRELLEDFNALMAFKAKEKGLEYNVRIHGELPYIVKGDSVRMRQVLNNIVGNAIKFTDKGFVDLEIKIEDDQLKFVITDSGCGIDEESIANLFQPFSQADNSMTRRYGGTGLGLNLTRRLSEAMGGSFYLQQSEVNKGSVFVVEIPIKVIAQSLPDMKQPSESNDQELIKKLSKELSDLKVLVVDDAIDNLRLMEIFLKSLNIQAELASSGEETLLKVQEQNFDIIFMDIQMPGKDGHETTQDLRSQGFDMPIIALTAHAMQEERRRCEKSGFSGFLSKPIDRASLKKTIFRKL